jgi:hypothetical protein
MIGFSFPENCQIVEALTPQIGAAGAVTGDYISLKNVQRAWVVIMYNQGDATSITWHVNRSPLVSGVGAVVTTALMPIWSDLDCATSDLMVARTAAVNYASGTGATHKIVIFEVDPTDLGILAGVPYDCIAGASTTAVAATSTVSMLYVLEPRYQSAVINQPSVIVD